MKKVCLIFMLLLASCSSKFLKYDKSEDLKVYDEFDKKVHIKAAEGTEAANTSTNIPIKENTPSTPTGTTPDKPVEKKDETPVQTVVSVKKQEPVKKKKKKKKGTEKVAVVETPVGPPKHIPELENADGFEGRRPLVDPFRVGEEVIHNVHYFKVSAGTLTLKMEPFVTVNDRKAYSFVTSVQSSSMFSTFYSVDDKVVTLMDFEQLIPTVFKLHVKESGQLREARSFFDFDQGKAIYWEKKVTQKNGVEEKKLEWEILPYSQNMFSSFYYMRLFKWEIGKEYAFRVADDGENHVFKGKALRREVLKTEIGDRPAIVIKPEVMTKGVFKPVGDIFIWLSDDDRKFILRIESSIKIGTIISEVVKLNPGQP